MASVLPGGGSEGQTLAAAAGGYTVTAHTRGASLATLTGPSGRNLIVPTTPAGPRIADAGATLAPWPNRLEDGTYTFEGIQHTATIDEPDRHNALHGLVRNAFWTPLSSPASEITLAFQLPGAEPYPFPIRLTATFHLDTDGLLWSLTAENTGNADAPYAAALHPYLVAGDWKPGRSPACTGWTLTLPGTAHLSVDPDRLLPTGITPIDAETALDARHPIGTRALDLAYTGFPQSPVRATLTDPHGRGTALEFSTPWAQVYTDDGDGRRGVAVEPQTAPANALRGHPDLIVLHPGEHHTLQCRIQEINAD